MMKALTLGLAALLPAAMLAAPDCSEPPEPEPQACYETADCDEGLTCTGVPNPFYGVEAPGCCLDRSPIPGEGASCEVQSDCEGDLLCIGSTCSASWMADSYHSEGSMPVAAGGVTVDQIVVACLATVPVESTLDLSLSHPRPQDLRITVTDPGHTSDALVYDGEQSGDGVELVGVPFFATSDDAVNGPWTLTITDQGEGDGGELNSWSLHLTSRWD